MLASVFEIGHFLRARIILKAILYYAGEMMIEDDDGEEEEEEEEEEDEEDQVKNTLEAGPNHFHDSQRCCVGRRS